ncbi:MAG TPA: TlpA disulfide reductase family protein [Acetobacteraceae bacterium]|nr:TlpA disulfide reductase family protein [Acetobacteraceae bacterium]
MPQSPRLVRRTALGLLATLPLGVTARRASAASTAEAPQTEAPQTEAPQAEVHQVEARQAEALAHAEFVDPQGTPHRMSELTRPLVLVNLWAAWCPGCLEELPTIHALAALLGSESIDVVLLSHAMNWHGDQSYMRSANLPFRHWRLSGQVPESVEAAAFRMEADRFALPQSLVFAGRDRVVVRAQEGSLDWMAPDQVRLARRWLAAAG